MEHENRRGPTAASLVSLGIALLAGAMLAPTAPAQSCAAFQEVGGLGAPDAA